MNTFLNTILIVIGFISFIPVINIFKSAESKKYRCLKYLIYTTFAWTLIVFIERFVSSLSMVYYAHMLSYPVKFFLAATMLCTIFDYIERKIPRWVFYTLGILLLGEMVLALSNDSTNYILELSIINMQSFNDLYNSANGSLFIVHLVITYLVLVLAIIYLFVFLRRNKGVVQYKAITRTMAISAFIVLLFNALQILVFKSNVDLTYVSLVIVVYALYQVIFRKDMIFNLKTSGRGEILSNMREMYIITDSEKRVVELSSLLIEKYNLNEYDFIGKTLNDLIHKLEERVVFYNEIEVSPETTFEKDHLHLREKKFVLKGMNQFGYMILLYDETQMFNLLRELNRLSNFDTMTGLNNRNYIEHELEITKSTQSVGIISLDLNGLKANNDYLGHERGDFLLKRLAVHMKIACESEKKKHMARIGGDEFLIILNNTTEGKIKQIKEKILVLSQHEDLLERVSVSIGVAFDENESSNIYELIQKADKRMYDMKKQTSKPYTEEIIQYVKKMNQYIR